MLPKVNMVARLARDVEVRYSKSGSAIANFSVASSNKYKTQSGEQKEDTTFIDCTAFSRLAEICNQYLRKGSQVYIIGDLKLDQWTAQDGSKRSRHSVIVESMTMLGCKDGNQSPQNNDTKPESKAQNQQETIPEVDIDSDEIPF